MLEKLRRPHSPWRTEGGQLIPFWRSPRVIRVAVVAVIFLLITNVSYLHFNAEKRMQRTTGKTKAERDAVAAAGNSTLGFSNIKYINLPTRYDRSDAANLQAYLSGLDIEHVSGVLADDLHDVGLPPSHRPGELRTGELGCWRAHANIWSDMLRDNTPTTLIVESDAAWDIHVRRIMSNMNEHFASFLQEFNSTTKHNPRFGLRGNHITQPGSQIVANPNDPWHSDHWDILSLGQCFESDWDAGVFRVFPDADTVEGYQYHDVPLGRERVVRKSDGIVCTTAYAISQTGAAKLLLRGAVDLDNPVDLLIRRLIKSGDLTAYTVLPTVFAQWDYAEKIGMEERGANSDINGEASDEEVDLSGWPEVQKSGSVWTDKWGHPDILFRNNALERAWKIILRGGSLEKSQHSDETGN